ncbi:MAG: YihY/virulence factor BrkB family protein [Bacteroidales bacterium]|nr:YihY/virulence factor BrkB family protein [Candidatus Hennigimonas equi]
MGLGDKVKRARNFVADDIWDIELATLGRYKRNFVQSLKIVMLTIRTFNSQKIGFQSVALSFFCTMAVVPFIAVTLAVTKGLGLSDKVEALLYANFPNNPDVIQNIMTYADNIILKASSSVLGFISAAFFVWLVIWMMLCVEMVFNNVWKVRQSRKFATRFWRDVVIVLISPFLMLLLYSGAIMLSGYISTGIVRWVLMVLASMLVFSLMYKLIPNTKVRYGNALKASVVSALAYTAIQFVYVESQIFLARLSGIYGAIAAIPFFMFWLNFSWYVILVGAELSYAFQNVNNVNADTL